MTMVMNKKNRTDDKIKSVVVKFGKYKLSSKMNSDLYNDECDMIIEACTRIIEKMSTKNPIKKISPMMSVECEINGETMSCVVNMYKILINASKYKIAEILRKQFLKEYDVDLKKEPIRSKIYGRT